MTTLYWHPTGPLIEYADGKLSISDLNPEVKTSWTMTRGQMLVLAWRCLVAALSGLRKQKLPPVGSPTEKV